MKNFERSRRLADMTVHELAQLRLLNEKLIQAEHWIHRRVTQCRFDYYTAGGQEAANLESHVSEDFEVDASVWCVLRETHLDFKTDDDNIVAQLSGAALLVHNEDKLGVENWNEVWEPEPHPLSDMRFCWLFHDLFDHTLKGNWERMLDIGGVWVEVTLTQQREVYW
jgi:hypothetical protein